MLNKPLKNHLHLMPGIFTASLDQIVIWSACQTPTIKGA